MNKLNKTLAILILLIAVNCCSINSPKIITHSDFCDIYQPVDKFVKNKKMDDEISNYIKEILNKYQKKEISKAEERFALLMIDFASTNEIIHTKKCIDNKNKKK